MTDTILQVKDADGVTQDLAVKDGGAAGYTPYHVEDATQRAALISALGLLATDAHAASILSALSGTLAVSGPLTDTQLRATAVPVSGTFYQATQPISVASLPLPAGAATEATLAAASAKLPATLGQKAKAAALAVTLASDEDMLANLGSLTETAPASDTASSGINGRLQRIAQRITALFGTAGTASANVLSVQGIASMTALKVDVSAQSVSPFVVAPSSSAAGANPNGLIRVNAGASTNATSVKGGAGRLFSGKLCNAAAYDVFFKVYNKASAPTVGTDTPAFTVMIKAGTCQDILGAWGVPLSTGIAYAITKLQADSDTTAVVAGDLTGYLVYA